MLETIPHVAIDTEASGFGELIEVALIRRDPGRPEIRFESLIHFDGVLDGPACRIHGLRTADVAFAPTFAQLAANVAALLHGAYIVGHNPKEDIRALAKALQAHSPFTLTAKGFIDTLALAERAGLGGQKGALRLRNLAFRLGVPVEDAGPASRSKPEAGRCHGAMSDAAATLGIANKLLQGGGVLPQGTAEVTPHPPQFDPACPVLTRREQLGSLIRPAA